MKKQITLLMLIGMVIVSANFNSAFGQATIANNTITAYTDYLGSFNSADVAFKANNTQFGVMLATGQWGIGTAATNPASQLSVGGNGSSSYEIFGHNSSGANGAQGIRGEVATPSSSGNRTYATLGLVTCGTGYAYGLYGSSNQATQGTGGRAYGVYGIAGNATCGYNYGVYGKVTSNGGCAGLSGGGAGIYGANCSADDSLIVGCWAGYFSGGISVRSTVTEKYGTTQWTAISDKRLKKNISPFADGLSVLRKINPVNFEYNGIGGTPTGENFIGVIAQDVQPVAPYCIGKSNVALQASETANFVNDIKGNIGSDSASTKYIAEVLNYNSNGLFYVMLNSIKQLDSTVTTLQNKIATLEGGNQRHNNSGSGNDDSGKNIQDVKLALQDVATLGEARPNPNNGKAEIDYYLPSSVSNAKIIFTDLLGRVINETKPVSGYGTISVDTQDLPNGNYVYSLVVDGKVIDAKKMIRNK